MSFPRRELAEELFRITETHWSDMVGVDEFSEPNTFYPAVWTNGEALMAHLIEERR